MGKLVSKEEFISRLNRPDYKLIDGYTAMTKKALFEHTTCGHRWNTLPKTILNGTASCPVCAGHKKSLDDVISFLDSKNIEILNVSSTDDINVDKKYDFKCKCCGNISNKRLGVFIENLKRDENRIYGCSECYYKNKVRLSPEEYENRFNTLVGDRFELITPYSKSEDKIKVKCLKCNCEFERLPADVFRYDCPHCQGYSATHKSKAEQELYSFIKEYYPTAIESYKDNNKEIDIFIPDINIGIEYNGLYWHSDKFVDKFHDRNKMQYFNSKGIRIINIFEDEYINNKDIVLSKLRNIIGKSNLPKIYGRKCVVKEISSNVKADFLNKNHIQGTTGCDIALGAFYNDTLVSVMTFKKSKSETYELNRFASDINYSVIGTFGKLLKYFKNNYEFDSISSFADLRWCDPINNIYEKNNFTNVETIDISYYYCKNYKRLHKSNFMKSKIKNIFPDIYDETLSEFELMDKTQYYRVWDCGKIKYVYKK